MRIGVFDSGIGGLTVLKELVRKYPKNQYFYFGDNKNMPYGSKSKKELLNLSSNIVDFLISKNVDILVIACGTLSSNVYEELKNKYNLPIYDIISPTIKYINDNYKKVGLIATKMTVQSKVFEKKISNICSQACPLFVPIIENNNFNELNSAMDEYFMNISKDIEALILGCTHYPILTDYIKPYFPNTELINMGKVLADNIEIKNSIDKSVRLYFSKVDHTLIENVNKILDFDYQLEEVNA